MYKVVKQSRAMWIFESKDRQKIPLLHELLDDEPFEILIHGSQTEPEIVGQINLDSESPALEEETSEGLVYEPLQTIH